MNKKYRIIKAFPEGYIAQKKVLLWWKTTVFDSNTNKPFIYDSIEEATGAITRLIEYGTVVKTFY